MLYGNIAAIDQMPRTNDAVSDTANARPGMRTPERPSSPH
jgi:hypothetical protein